MFVPTTFLAKVNTRRNRKSGSLKINLTDFVYKLQIITYMELQLLSGNSMWDMRTYLRKSEKLNFMEKNKNIFHTFPAIFLA